jgi:RAQPRD family integrative conjugative element protein
MSSAFPLKHLLPCRSAAATLLAALCLAAALPARADDLEREKLARIASELQNVQAMVEDARQSAQERPSGQVQFRYDWLERDLQMMREGIEQHIDAPRQPRPVPPLRGDYRQ